MGEFLKFGIEEITRDLVSAHPLDRDGVNKFLSTVFADDLHAKRVAYLFNAAAGVLEGAALGFQSPFMFPQSLHNCRLVPSDRRY